MIIRCAWCQLDMGSKCPQCGLPGHFVVDDSIALKCDNMHVWLRGEGGVTDGICVPCRKVEFPDLRVAVTHAAV